MKKIVKDLKSLLKSGNVKENCDLGQYLTIKVRCRARVLVEVYNKRQLVKVLDYLTLNRVKYVIIGGGSNLIFKRATIKEVVVHLNNGYNRIYFSGGQYRLYAFAGCRVSALIKRCLCGGYSCLEWATGIPASIGGATAMNMGAFGNCIADRVLSVTYYAGGKIYTIKNNGKNLFSYRNSVLKLQKCVILGVVLKLSLADKQKLRQDIADYAREKSTTQPLNFPSCGCVFKNGEEYFSARLIQDCNLKGSTIGGAMVSVKHSNFIINYNNATSGDLLKLINYVKRQVYNRFGVELVEEVEII